VIEPTLAIASVGFHLHSRFFPTHLPTIPSKVGDIFPAQQKNE
jgi:hypothetical protein